MAFRPQFDLRTLLIAVTACGVVIGMLTNWGGALTVFVFMASPGMAAALLACLIRLAVGYSAPSRNVLIASAAIGAVCTFLLPELEVGFGSISIVWAGLCSVSVSLWIAAVAVWWALRCHGDNAHLIEVRNAARMSLGVLFAGAMVSALLLATACFVRGRWGGSEAMPIGLAVAAAGILAALPWIRVVRRRSVDVRRYGFAEYASLTALVVSTVLAMLTLASLVIWAVVGPIPRSGFFDLNEIFFGGVIISVSAASVLAFVGVLIELWRDQWHPRMTAAVFTWAGTFWLTLIFYGVATA